MRWREALHPVGMRRVAVVMPRQAARGVLVALADEGTVDLDDLGPGEGDPATPAAALLAHAGAAATGVASRAPALAEDAGDMDRWVRDGRADLLAGEAELQGRSAQAVDHGSVAALVGWMPTDDVAQLTERLRPLGGALVPLPRPAGVDPPTQLSQRGAAREFAPLAELYATVPYADVDPSVLAGTAYVVMFGMMFADVGHGALLLLVGIAVRLEWSPRLAPLRRVWLFLAGGGLASMLFGLLYGECFGPTGLVPVVWLAPLDEPVKLLVAAVGVGALLLAGAYVVGSVNRFREGGWRLAAYAPSGLAGGALFLGLAAVAGGLYLDLPAMLAFGATVAAGGLVAAGAGLLVAAGGGAAGAAQAGVELFDLVVRLGSNVVSFARLAAFGLTHAALGAVVWQATTGLWERSLLAAAAAVLVFVVGNALSFALEALVAGVQALRLEYYELFSRLFVGEGRPFRPWHVPLATPEVPS